MRSVLCIVCLSLAASLVAAQQQTPTSTGSECCAVQSGGDGSTAVTPQQLRRVGPPPEHASAAELETMGDDLRAAKSYADALDYYRAAMKRLDRQNAVLLNKSGITQLKLLRYREAKKDFQQATKLQPDYAEAYNNLGVVDYINRKYRGAIKQYRKAVQLRPLAASFHSNLGTAHFARKEYDKAGVAYLRALELDPEIFERQSGSGVSAHMASPQDRARYAYTIAKMHAQLGDTERCLLYLRKAMEDGFPQIDDVYRDKEFALVREDPRFVELMAERPVAIP